MNLGDFWITITTKGTEAFNAAVDKAKGAMDSLTGSSKKFEEQNDAAMKKAAGQFSAFSKSVYSNGQKLGDVFKPATASVSKFNDKLAGIANGIKAVGVAAAGITATITATFVGFAKSGLDGTVQQERLTYQIQRFAREVASIALPVVDFLTEGFRKAASMMQTMSGVTQDLVLRLGAITAGLGGMAAGAAGVALGIGMMANPATFVAGLLTTLGGTASFVAGAFTTMLSIADKVWPAIKAAIAAVQPVLDTIYAQFTRLGNMINGSFTQIGDLLTSLQPIINMVAKTLVTGFSFALDVIIGIVDAAKMMLDTMTKIANFAFGTKRAPQQPQQPAQPGNGRRTVTPQAAGLEGVGAAYNRIAQSVAKQWDPQRAHDQAQALAQKQLAATQQVARNTANAGGGLLGGLIALVP